jgi:hypothetical protein
MIDYQDQYGESSADMQTISLAKERAIEDSVSIENAALAWLVTTLFTIVFSAGGIFWLGRLSTKW